jgi:multidrug transporter EmrE-like cation transporter
MFESLPVALKEWMDQSILDETILIVIALAITEAIGQNLLKNSSDFDYKVLFGLSIYIIIGYLLHYSYQRFPLSKINVMWSSLSIITATILGYSLYNESLNKNAIFSVIFALLSIYFMSKAN